SLRPLLVVLGVSAPSASLPERRHRIYVFVARTGVAHDHDVVGTEVARRLELAQRGHRRPALRRHEQALGGGRFLAAWDALRLRHRDAGAVALAQRAQDEEVADGLGHAEAVSERLRVLPE